MKISEIVRIFDVEAFEAGNGDVFRFRLEILRSMEDSTFIGKAYRFETYRLQPTFPQLEGTLPEWQSDSLICVADEMFNVELLIGKSVDEVLNKFQSELSRIFG